MFSGEERGRERAEQTRREAVTVTSACPNERCAVCGRVLWAGRTHTRTPRRVYYKLRMLELVGVVGWPREIERERLD